MIGLGEKEMRCFLKAFILCWEFLPSFSISCDVKTDVNQKKFNKSFGIPEPYE